MNKLKNRALRTLVLLIVILVFSGKVKSQQRIMTTDTVYHSVYGCDSLLLPANNVVYYTNTTVKIPHYATSQGKVYMDVLNVYNVEIGQSFNVYDTVSDKICRSNLPYCFHGHFFTRSGNFNVDFPTINGCDSAHVYLKLQVLNGQCDTINLGICANQPSIQYQDITFDTPGTFDFVQGYDVDGCPIVKTYVVDLYPVVVDTLDVQICQADLPYTFAGQSFNSTGSYVVNHTTIQGCSATTLLNLTVYHSTRSRITIDTTVCPIDMPFEYADGIFELPGDYFVLLKNKFGCDSALVSLKLSVEQQIIDTIDVSICEHNLPYIHEDITFGDFGEYYIEKQLDTLCSPYTLLRLSKLNSGIDTSKVCLYEDSYTFYDSVFTESGTYIVEDTNSLQCIDKHILILTLYPEIINDTVRETICSSEVPFDFYGKKCYTTGSYTEVLKNQNGCDSAIVKLLLTVDENPQTTKGVTITRNDLPYIYRDTVLTKSGTYVWNIPSANGGCDTIETLNLNIVQKITVERDTIFCANETITYLGETISRAGKHFFTYHLPEYDSVIILNVKHYPTYRDETIYLSIGEYDVPYRFADSTYTTEGYHEQTLKTINGCDSVVSIFLTINLAVINNDTIYREICSNDLPYMIFDSLLQTGGVHRFLTRSQVSDFDSVFYVRLNVKPSPALVVPDTTYLCTGNQLLLTAQSTGSSFVWSSGENTASINVTLAGTYSVTTTNAYDCSTTATIQVVDADIPEVTIAGDNTLCKGTSTTLRAFGGKEYLWSNGAITDSIVVTPLESTNYTVTVTNIYGCVKTGSISINVRGIPSPEIVGNNSICQNDSTTLMATGGSSYIWSTGSTSNKISVNSEGLYSVTAIDENGCQNVATLLMTVNPLPEVRILGRNTFCQGGNTTLTATGGANYEWNTGEMTQSINVSLAGTYTVTGIDNNGCSTSKSVVVSREDVNATIIGNRNFCNGQSTTLTVSDAGNYTYKWFDGSTSNSITISQPGQYSVIVTNANGCQNTLTATVSEYSMPTPTISGTLTICEGQSTVLRASGGNTYLWDNGSTDAIIHANATGTYSVTVTNQYGCTATTSASVLVNPAPTVTLLSDDNICSGDNVTISAISNGTTYNWASGQNTAIINVSPSVTTTYTVLVTDDNGCSTTASKQLIVNQLPTVYISGVTTVCSGDTARLTANGGTSYIWSNNMSTASINVTTPGNYSVVATNSAGCTATASKTVVVNELPTISFSGENVICQGSTAKITASGAVNYVWSTGENTATVHLSTPGFHKVTASNIHNCISSDSIYITINSNPIVTITGEDHICANTPTILSASGAHTYVWSTDENTSSIAISPAVSTTYTVTGYSINGCSSNAVKTVLVESLPNVSITGQFTLCRGNSTVLTAVGGSSYQWNTGENVANISVTPNHTTTYTVRAFNSFGCYSDASATVQINVLPSISFSGTTSVCDGNIASVTVSGGNTYVWSNGTVGNTLTTGTAGIYKVTATNSLNCQRTDSIQITVWSKPTVSIEGQGLLCKGSSTVLSALGAQTYSWNTGENASSITIMPTQSTTYSVTGTDYHGCTATANKVVNVEQLPNVNISGILSICQGDSTILTATGGHNFLWNNGSTNTQITVSEHGSYSVTATSLNGCEATANVVVVNNPNPSFSFLSVDNICENTTEKLSVEGDYNYLWSTGSTEKEITISEGGVYSVTATNEYGCTKTITKTIEALLAPFVQILGVESLCQDESTTLTASSNAVDFLWSTGDSTPTITVIPNNTTYELMAIGENGCSSMASHHITTRSTYNYTVTGTICEYQTFSQYGFDIPIIDSAGTYTFSRNLETVYGCDSTINLLLTVNPLPRLDSITGPQHITQYGSLYYSVNNPQHVNNYEWRVSNTHWTLSNADYSVVTMTVNTNGNGVLTARGINNCGYTEQSVNIFCNVSVEDYEGKTSIKLYPNPVHQSLFIDFGDKVEYKQVRLYDERGRLIFSAQCEDYSMEIDCTKYANGHYTLVFTNEKGNRSETRKIIINNR